MWQIIALKNKNNKLSDQGFITIEIIVSLFIASAFLMVSLQTLVAAMAFKVQAQEKQRADKLIQEDIERLNDLGSILDFGSRTANIDACDGDSNNDGTADDGYSQRLWNDLLADTPNGDPALSVKLIAKVSSSGTAESGKTLTLARTSLLTVPTSGSPNRILGINYQVTDDTGATIANRYVEAIPDAALECP